MSAGAGGEGGDDEVCRLIVEKFDKLGHGEVSYADIATKAWEVGRASLATKVNSKGLVWRFADCGVYSCWIMSRMRLIRFHYC